MSSKNGTKEKKNKKSSKYGSRGKKNKHSSQSSLDQGTEEMDIPIKIVSEHNYASEENLKECYVHSRSFFFCMDHNSVMKIRVII